MGSGFIEPDEVIEQLVIEGLDALEQQVFVELDEHLLESVAEALGMGIHAGALGIGQPTHGLGCSKLLYCHGQPLCLFPAVQGAAANNKHIHHCSQTMRCPEVQYPKPM